MREEFTRLIDALLCDQEPRPGAFVLLSDLDRESAAALRAAWPRIAEHRRQALVSEAALLAQNNLDFDFERAMTIALDDPLAPVRREAIAGLAGSTSREVGPKLAGLVAADPDPSVRGAAAATLSDYIRDVPGGAGYRAAYDAVVTALRTAAADATEEPEVRALALASVAGSGESWVSELITEAFYSDDRTLRLGALEAMGRSVDEQWLEFLFNEFESDDADVRYEAAVACGEIGSEDAVEPLAALAGDEEASVAEAAVHAIAEIGGTLAIQRLRDLLHDPPAGLDVATIEDALLEATGPFGSRGDDR